MPDELGDDEPVTQYGSANTDPHFFTKPKPNSRRPDAMSLIRGRLTPEEATLVVTGRQARPGVDLARYARIECFREKGFDVRHTPSPMNPDHVSVITREDEWTDNVAERFDKCFEGETDG